MLRRHRRSAAVSGSIAAFGGPIVHWLLDHRPDLAPVPATRTPAEPRVLPVPSELEPLLAGPGDVIAGAVVAALDSGVYKWSHRALLLNTAARVARPALGSFIAGVRAGRDRAAERDAGGSAVAPLSLWEALLELATVRRDMLDELESAR
jgi:hypothetical protein